MSPRRPLDGIRVIECANDVAAPFCARMLADLGAEVVKVEPPGGDPVRQWKSSSGATPESDAGVVFHYLNAGKRGVVADLDLTDDLEWFDSLLARADVFVEGLDPEQVQQWNLDAPSLESRHPHLIVASVTPHGRAGSWAGNPGSDLTATALSSLCVGLGDPQREPLRLPYDQASFQAALHAVAAVLCALRERDGSGLGQSIDIATAQVMGYCVGGMWLVIGKNGTPWHRKGVLQPGMIYPGGFFECKDGFICIASQSPRQWKTIIKLMGSPDWAADERAQDAWYLGQHPELVDAHFRAWLGQFTREELTRLAMSEEITLGAVLTIDEVLKEEHFVERKSWSTLTVDGRDLQSPTSGLTMSATPLVIGTSAPPLGADTESVRADRRTPITMEIRPRERAPLDGIRILDFTWNWAGPMATQLLAEAGAEVIRVETSKRQDLTRLTSLASWFFCNNNRSKRSITINMTLPEGRELIYGLLAHTDVVINNFAPGVMEKNGLGWETLHEIKSDLIYVSLSIAGLTGPLRHMRGFASIGTAFVGLERMVGYEEGAATGLMSFGLGDVNLAIHGTIGTLAALRHRDRTGEGQLVDASMLEASLACLAEPLLDYQLSGALPGPQGNRHSAYVPHGIYKCLDEDRWVAIVIRTQAEWQSIARVIGHEDWAEEAELATTAGRRLRVHEIDAAITAWCRDRERDDVAEVLNRAAVPVAPVLELEERDAHPHFVARGFRLEHDAPGFEPCRIYASPWLLSATPLEVKGPTPALGQDNDYVFRSVMGLSQEEVERLVAEGVIA